MTQPVTPAAPAAATPAPAAPAATPAAPAPAPAADPVKQSVISSVLGLVRPEQKDVRPATPAPVSEPAKGAAPEPTPAAKVDEPAPAAPPATPAPPAAVTPETPAAPARKVEVKPKGKQPSIADVVKEVLKTQPQPAAPAPAPAAPATPTPAAEDPDLTPEEREELELARFAETRDPARKGLADQFRAFYKAQKEFIEKAAKKAEDAGEEYDPTSDPEYKKFLARAEPKFSRADRKKFDSARTAESARTEALKEAEQRFTPQLEELTRKTRELEHRPVIQQRLATYADELTAGMPEEVVKFYNENGKDLAKTQSEYPFETEAILSAVRGAQALAEEYLSVKAGTRLFDPAKNDRHRFLSEFVMNQADTFLRSGGDALKREGKEFVHPRDWKADMAATHWTFADEDVLRMLRVEAQREARERITGEEARLKKLGFIRQPKAAAPVSAPVAAAPAPAEPAASPRTPVASLPGASTPPAPAATSKVGQVLGLG